MYQRPSIKREVIANNENISKYEPIMGTQLLDSLKYGWDILSYFGIYCKNLGRYCNLHGGLYCL